VKVLTRSVRTGARAHWEVGLRGSFLGRVKVLNFCQGLTLWRFAANLELKFLPGRLHVVCSSSSLEGVSWPL
jgi:hypothetical protein